MNKIFKKNKIKTIIGSRGAVSLIMVMIILSVILAIVTGSSFIISNGLMASLRHSDSVVAFYAAETGIEQALFDHKTQEPAPAARCGTGWASVGVARYCLSITETTPGDYLTITKIQSTGEYKNTRRSIEITF